MTVFLTGPAEYSQKVDGWNWPMPAVRKGSLSRLLQVQRYVRPAPGSTGGRGGRPGFSAEDSSPWAVPSRSINAVRTVSSPFNRENFKVAEPALTTVMCLEFR